MKFWKIVTVGVIGALISKASKNAKERAEEEQKRKITPCRFDDGISEEEFETIAKKSGKHIKRLTDISVYGPIVYGSVRTQSGLSEWNFKIDFNDYGHITGRYWLSADNEDSSIPGHIACNMSKMIAAFPRHLNQNEEKIDYYENEESIRAKERLTEQLKQRNEELAKRKNRLHIVFVLCLIIVAFGLFGWEKYQQFQKRIEVGFSQNDIIGINYKTAESEFKAAGFTNINLHAEDDLKIDDAAKEYIVTDARIRGNASFMEDDKYPYDAKVEIIYHVVKDITLPVCSKDARKMSSNDLVSLLNETGFVNISTVADRDLITGWITKEDSVEEISIGGDHDFSQNDTYRPDVEIVIIYHAFKEK